MAAISVVLLTMGDRPKELAAAIRSARDQLDVEVEVVMVVNGGEPDRTLADIVVEPGENLGIPGGRNAGASVANGDYLAFLDDDGSYEGKHVMAGAAAIMADRSEVAVVGLCIVDEDGRTARRHHPALGGDPTVSGDVTSFPGGGCVVRREAFDHIGGLCREFFYALEETDLAWRMIDAGWIVHHAAELRMRHPSADPNRHPEFHRRTARNRVWLAHRLLPLPLAVLYVANWTLVTALRNIRSWSALAAHGSGTLDGIRHRLGPRSPMKWASVVRLGRLGRPPII